MPVVPGTLVIRLSRFRLDVAENLAAAFDLDLAGVRCNIWVKISVGIGSIGDSAQTCGYADR
jgi:hypothetical protein